MGDATEKYRKEIERIMDAYMVWHSNLIRAIAFLGRAVSESPDDEAFLQWLDDALSKEIIDTVQYDKAKKMHNVMRGDVDALLAAEGQGSGSAREEKYNKFEESYARFYKHLRRLSSDCLLEENGIDPYTGLRHKSALRKDLDVEMERLARHGRPFSLSMACIDQHALVKTEQGGEAAREYTIRLSKLIKRCLRSFDDAYRIGDGKFVFSLKQADVAGGLSALERLNKMLDKQSIDVNLESGSVPLTITCCVSEPVPEDNVDSLLENLESDLKEIQDNKDHGGAVLQYHEMSPLQRFIKQES